MGELANKQIIPRSAEDARKVSSPIYFTGRPCPKGHIANRYTSGYCCVECKKAPIARERNQKWYKENGSIRNKRKQSDRKVNPSKYAKQQKNWRDRNPRQAMLIAARSRAKLAGLDFNIDLSDVVIPENCPILGIRLKAGKEFGRTNSPSLDRIDNSKGYIKGNVAVISTRANILKRDASLYELVQLVKYMRKHDQD